MLTALCVLVILGIAYAHHREGLFTAINMLVSIFMAGILSFNFWEPTAAFLDSNFQGTFLAGCEDFLAMVVLFSFFLGMLRLAANSLSFKRFQLEPNVDRFGGGVIGLVSGYLVAGFLASALETLPWHENFMGFTPRLDSTEAFLRTVMPPDRVWLAIMRHAGANDLCNREINPDAETNYDRYVTFDPYGTFELRYLRYRRYNDLRDPLAYQGEFDREVGKRN